MPRSRSPLFYRFQGILLLISFLGFLTVMSCGSTKSGCPANEKADSVKLDKNGNMSGKKGSSNLFPKGMRKKYGM